MQENLSGMPPEAGVVVMADRSLLFFRTTGRDQADCLLAQFDIEPVALVQASCLSG